jgi:hypothetical protein
MLDLPNMEARQRANNHGDHKAKAYMAKPYVLFIESELNQAIEINRISKPVLCTANFEMIFESESFMYNLKKRKTYAISKKICFKGER